MHIEITELIENATAETRESPDVALNIEISDRVNNSGAEYVPLCIIVPIVVRWQSPDSSRSSAASAVAAFFLS